MNRASHYANWAKIIYENTSNTVLAATDFDAVANLAAPDFYMMVDEFDGLFIDRFSPIPQITITPTGAASYPYKGITMPGSNGSYSISASGGLTTFTDTGAKFLTTSHIAPGDYFVQSSVNYIIAEIVSETIIKIIDSGAAVSAAAYTLKSNPMFILEAKHGQQDYYYTLQRVTGFLPKYDRVYDGMLRYRTAGNNIEVVPRMSLKNALVIAYAPNPITWSAYISSVTNPLPFTDDINLAFDYYCAAKYFETNNKPDFDLVNKNEARAKKLLTRCAESGQSSFPV